MRLEHFVDQSQVFEGLPLEVGILAPWMTDNAERNGMGRS